jgi:DNA-directed RNA polymerase subunit alpha
MSPTTRHHRPARCQQGMIDPDLQQKLNMTVQELDLVGPGQQLPGIGQDSTVRDLVKKTDADLLKVRSFGKTSLREVKRKLADMGLSLGMDLEGETKSPAV